MTNICKNCGHKLRKKRNSNSWMHQKWLRNDTCLEIVSKEGNKPPYKNVKYCFCNKSELK